MKTPSVVLAIGLALSLRAYAQDCDQLRGQATWKSTTLLALTSQCAPIGWESFFSDPAVNAEVKKISDELKREVHLGDDVNPSIGNVFRALYTVPPNGIKAVIIGQDPAPGRGEATGLAFSLKPGTPSYKVPSVQRVMLEAQNEGFGEKLPDGDLSQWAQRGVLMLNTALTIPCKKEETSCRIGGHLTLWKAFSKKLIARVDQEQSVQAFILWGSKAAKLSSSIKNPLHHAIAGGHPSPVAPGKNFFCKAYFTCSNTWLTDHAREAIDWNVTEGETESQACIWSPGKVPKCTTHCSMATCP
jgi:uracil-DNA glycosylase